MKIVVFGATGMIGTRIAAELEQRGHAVTAATRGTGADVTDPQSVASVAADADAVVSAVSARGVSYTVADVAPALVEGLREAGVRSLLFARRPKRRRGSPKNRKMGIKQNYLYRVLPGLEQEKKIKKESRGWHPAG